MPASTRTHSSRATSRPYDSHSPTASSTQSLSHQSPPTSPVQNPENPPDHPGLPTYAEYKRIEAGYLHSLSPRKRDKALITQAMFDKIWDVLHQPEACTIETPQFRFWVRKMFTLNRPTPTPTSDVNGAQWKWGSGPATTHPRNANSDGENQGEEEEEEEEEEAADLELECAMGIARGTDADAALLNSAVVLHENRPVAIMEQLYELFCYCHVRAGHGGRDKTCAVIRQHYSWVPKELTAQFVKTCPTCALKRSGGGELGVVMQRRASGGRERKGRGKTVLGATGEEMSVGPSSLGWPTSGGPLDPANPQPCGVRERERLRVRWDAEPVDPSSLLSPARGSRMGSAPKEVPLESCLSSRWNSMPPALTARVDVPPSPFHLCDPTHALGTTSFSPQTFPVETKTAAGTIQGTRTGSPRTSGLPPLASALPNESLNDNVNLTRLGPNDALHRDKGGVCLPPALRPLRLSGRIPSNTGEPESEDADLFQIDPVLLSFSYPGPGLGRARAGSSGFVSSGADAQAYADQRMMTNMNPSDRLRVRESDGMGTMMMPALETSESPTTAYYSDSPDSSFESATSNLYYRHHSTTGAGTAAMSIFKPFNALSSTSRCAAGSQYCGYGYDAQDDGPLATMLLPCSTDEVDGTLSRFSILTDA